MPRHIREGLDCLCRSLRGYYLRALVLPPSYPHLGKGQVTRGRRVEGYSLYLLPGKPDPNPAESFFV
jgi:hypothetical protein